jgi:hypothetical protein
MAALSADVDLPHKGDLSEHKISVKSITADTFYKGALVFADATNGKAQVSTPAAGDVFLGICAKQVVAETDDLVDIYTGGLWAIPFVGAAEGDVGDVCIVDVGTTPTDNPAETVTGADATLAANDLLIGKIIAIDIEEITSGWVQLRPGWLYSATLGWV